MNLKEGRTKMKNRIFLSYSGKDRPWVVNFANVLKKEGVDVWFDSHEIAPGEDFGKSLEKGLRSSSVLVVILSMNSASSPWIFFELGAAVADGKRIIPIVIDDIEYEKLPLSLTKYQHLHESSPIQAGKKIIKLLGM